MRVLLIHASADAKQATAFADVLEEHRGGFEVVRADEHATTTPSEHFHAVVLLWSHRLRPFPQHLDRAALDAWIENQLVLIALDDSERPLGLRDLLVVDAAGPRQIELIKISASAVRDALDTGTVSDFPDAEPPPPPASARGGGALVEYTGPLAFVALGLLIAGWLASSSAGRSILAGLLGLGLIVAIALFAWRQLMSWRLRQTLRSDDRVVRGIALGQTEPALPQASDLFVSYARADAAIVDQIVMAVLSAGKGIWIDRDAIRSGESWAGEIVRAIKAARGVLVMCSPKAFGSDHVKREVYLADKYKKPIVPIFVEPAEPPDDFEYFLAGLQRLDWYTASAQDRTAAIAKL